MTRLVLIRHGRSTANADGVLAGRAPGVRLDDRGREQAGALGRMLAEVPVAACYRSPVLRCRETAELAGFADATVEERLTECDYGEWTMRPLRELADEPLWKTVQDQPSQVQFPGGESMQAMAERVVAAATDISQRHGRNDVVVLVSHGDPLKALLSHALGQPFDHFQRLNVAPASVSVVRLDGDRPFVECVNAGLDLPRLLAAAASPTVGGGDVPAGEAQASA